MELTDILNVMYDARQNNRGLDIVTKNKTIQLSNTDLLSVSSIWQNPRGGHPTIKFIVLPDKTQIDVDDLVSAKKL